MFTICHLSGAGVFITRLDIDTAGNSRQVLLSVNGDLTWYDVNPDQQLSSDEDDVENGEEGNQALHTQTVHKPVQPGTVTETNKHDRS